MSTRRAVPAAYGAPAKGAHLAEIEAPAAALPVGEQGQHLLTVIRSVGSRGALSGAVPPPFRSLRNHRILEAFHERF